MCSVVFSPLGIIDLLNQHLASSMKINKLKSKETARDLQGVKEVPGNSHHLPIINIIFLDLKMRVRFASFLKI